MMVPGASGVLRPSRTIIVPGLRRPMRRAMIPTLQLGQAGLSHIAIPGAYSGWTPADLATPPSFWLDVDSAMTKNGTRVDQWNDRTANAFHFTGPGAGSATNPTFTDPDSSLSGLRTLTTDGTDDRLRCTVAGNRDIFNGASAAWCFIIMRKAGATTGLRFALAALCATAGAVRFSITSTNTANKPGIRARRADGDATVQLDAATSHDGNWNMWGFSLALGTRTGTIYYNDSTAVDAQNTTLTTAGATFSATSANEDTGFSARAGGSSPAGADWAMMMAGTTIPSAAEWLKIFGFGGWRYGLVARLSATSPYLLSPP